VVKVEFLTLKNEIYFQILLSSIGDCKNEIYEKKAKEYKAINKPMASAFFKLHPSQNLQSFEKDLEKMSLKVTDFVENKRKIISKDSIASFSLTKVPFYDIVIHKDPLEATFFKKKIKIIEEYLPRTHDQSTILNKIQFHELIEALPPVLRHCHWHLMYATMKHGTCFEVLFKLVGDYDFPNLLVIKDWKGNVFGAYFNEGWKRNKLFYGAGETFLYTFKKEDDLQVFSWTKKNDYFLVTNGDSGICIGTGDYFGLYIHPDLTKGYSYPSDTFDNDFLTDGKDFSIERLEVFF